MRIFLLLFILFVFVGCGQTKNKITSLFPVTNGKLAESEEEQKKFDVEQSETIEDMAGVLKEIEPESQAVNRVNMKAYSQAEEARRRANEASEDVEAYNSGPGFGDLLGGLTGDPTALMNIILAVLGISGVGYGAVKSRKADRLKSKGIELSELDPVEAMKKRREDPDFK